MAMASENAPFLATNGSQQMAQSATISSDGVCRQFLREWAPGLPVLAEYRRGWATC